MADDTAAVPGTREQPAPAADVGSSYQEDRPYLIRFLLLHGADFLEAEDAVQSAFVELMRSRRPVQHPRVWLRTVALRAFLRQTVPEQPEQDLTDRLAATSVDWRTPLEVAELSEQQRRVLQNLVQLPFKQRSVMAWHLDGTEPGGEFWGWAGRTLGAPARTAAGEPAWLRLVAAPEAAPQRMAVYDRRVQHALDTLGLTLTPTPGRYGRYLQLLDDLLHHGGARADGWTAREIDTALYWTGGSDNPTQPPTT
ncbi:RNA polymerase sigma factor [Streptomyces lutosisoli]|uniref:RNA polymerase sigma factor n=1 Tax=Streptomyces lutosisoli TaxID=2665721 RepID=A0ABW2VZ26_9ACTN